MKSKLHPDSDNPTIQALNRIVYATFKPTRQKLHGGTLLPGWQYGQLYYLGDCPTLIFRGFYPGWMLDGMTPVDGFAVLLALNEAGVEPGRLQFFHRFFRRLEMSRRRKEKRRQQLRTSAMNKLTEAESRACGLIP